jgi:hypothetical protein
LRLCPIDDEPERGALSLATGLCRMHPLGRGVEHRRCAGEPDNEKHQSAEELAIVDGAVEEAGDQRGGEGDDGSRYAEVATVSLCSGFVGGIAADACGGSAESDGGRAEEGKGRGHRMSPDEDRGSISTVAPNIHAPVRARERTSVEFSGFVHGFKKM